MDAASKREAGMLRRLAGGMVKLGRKMLTMNAEFLEDEEIIRITNESFVAIRREDLGGNFDLILDISTIEEDNAKAQESAFMLQTVGPDEDPEVRRMLLAKIFRLRKMPDIAKKLEDYKPAPDPMAERMAELQAERLEAEIEEIRSRTLENETDAQLNEAKAQTEGATTREKGSKADLNDLDFLEQESGTKQERQRELQSDKDGSQAQLKLLDNDIQAENSAAEGMKKFLQQ
jgi:type IV secretory pathway VirB10-like protein